MKKWSLKLKYPNFLQTILNPTAKSGLTNSRDTSVEAVCLNKSDSLEELSDGGINLVKIFTNNFSGEMGKKSIPRLI